MDSWISVVLAMRGAVSVHGSGAWIRCEHLDFVICRLVFIISIMIKMNLVRIVITELQEEQVIFLKEEDGTRVLPIMIGINEAIAIQRYVNKQQYPRPLTHDLMANIIQQLGYKVNRVVVTDLQGGVFYAKLILQNGAKSIEVDARPSDAVAVATRFSAPIFVEEKVIEKSLDLKQDFPPPFTGQEADEEDDEEQDKGGETV